MPRKPTPGLHRVRLELTAEERDKLNVVAALAGYTAMSHYLRALVLKVIEEDYPRKTERKSG
jgi:hypothetical protein